MFTPARPEPGQPPSENYKQFRSWSPAFGHMFGRSADTGRAGLLNSADLVVWQASRRLIIAAGLGVASFSLRLMGLAGGPAWPILVVVPIYIALIALITAAVGRRQYVTRVGLIALSLVDCAAIFTVAALATAPPFYPRALLLALLAMQFAQIYFVRTPAIATLGGSIVGYGLLLLSLWQRGSNIGWSEQAWMVCIFLLVALNGMALHASANRRLAMLVDLFSSAQRGDFSREFVDEQDREPDGITMLGRSYNHLRAELATMVHTDPLTGCLNRRGFDQMMSQIVATAARRGGEIALLAIDIDHFKSINDTIGHLGGDAVLRELVEILSRSSRGGDVVARVGGEEFVILLPDADNEMAGVVAERVLQSVRSHDFRTARSHSQVTVSVGIASEQVTDAHITGSLRARADEALYVAKRLGRDRVVMWAPGIRSNATPPWTDFVGLGSPF